MVDYDKAISQLKENLDKVKDKRIRAEARLEQLNKQKQEILKEIEELGVKPEDLDDEINKLKKDIDNLIEKTKDMIPIELLKDIEQ